MNEKAESTVLVVEDSVVQRRHMVSLLEGLGFSQVLEASDGQEALTLLAGRDGEALYLLITDVDMPGMDGIELIGRLSESLQVQNLIVTSARDPRMLETVESICAEDQQMRLLGTVPKPVSAAGLAALLKPPSQRAGNGGLKIFEPDAAEIARALAEREFLPYFQPKVAIATGRLKGIEALARWQHPSHGLLSPFVFIPALEGTPMMAGFTLLMVEQSLEKLSRWLRAMPSLTLSLNLSADNLADRGFVDRLVELVNMHEIEPASLIWEVTETMLMSKHSLANLARLGLKGFGLSMDDYGVGYSSMQTLSRSPFTELKIDRQFVNGAAERANRRAILNSALDMGRSLRISTVAEGVETLADWQLLSDLGCDVAQGYLLARPMPAEELMSWNLANRQRLQEMAVQAQSK
jgi:EAL domain-containing protein (putative c-di-GMP-specific phosphodiesterase class I)